MKSYLNHIKVDQKVKDLLKEIKQRQRKGSMINKYFYYHKFSLAFKYDKWGVYSTIWEDIQRGQTFTIRKLKKKTSSNQVLLEKIE